MAMILDDVTIREAREDDLGEILDLYSHLHEHDAPLPPLHEIKREWEYIIASKYFRYFVAEKGGRLISSCNLTIVPNLTRGARPFGVIENVITHPEARRQGYAQNILRYALDAAWQSNCYKVMLLSSSQRDGAHTLYEKVGFSRDEKIGFVARPK